jgi:hypothetical protein
MRAAARDAERGVLMRFSWKAEATSGPGCPLHTHSSRRAGTPRQIRHRKLPFCLPEVPNSGHEAPAPLAAREALPSRQRLPFSAEKRDVKAEILRDWPVPSGIPARPELGEGPRAIRLPHWTGLSDSSGNWMI